MNYSFSNNEIHTNGAYDSMESSTPALPLMEAILDMGKHISRISDVDYASVPSDIFTSSPGAQVRHTLDHVGALLKGMESGVMEYDIRERGVIVETDPMAALNLIANQVEGLENIRNEDMIRPVIARLLMNPAGEIMEHTSCVSREIAFVLSHTIHHNAILLSMLRFLGRETDDRFGFALATLAYNANEKK